MKNTMKYLAFACLLVGTLAYGQGGTRPPEWFKPIDGQWVVTKAGTASTFTCSELASSIPSSLGSAIPFNGGAYYCVILYDAGGSHAAPEAERRKVTSVSTAGLVTVDSAFTASPGVGDIFGLFPSIEGMIYGSEGLPRVGSAATIAAGVSLAEGLLYASNAADTASAAAQSIRGWVDTEIASIKVTAEQCSAYVADGTSEIDTTGENTRAAVNAIHLMVADGTGEIDTTLENTRAAVALALAAVADGTGEVDTTLENVRAATLSIHTAISDGTGEIDTTLENTRAAVALVLAATADGTGEIDTTLENTMTAVARIETYTDTEVGALRDSLEDANDHLQALRGVTTGFVDASVWQYVTVIVNFAGAGPWEEAASTHELFTVTGAVEFEITAYCSTDVTVTSADSIFFGGEGGADDFFGIYRALGSDITSGEGLFRGVNASTGAAVIPTAAILDGTGGAWKGTAWMGQDIGYDIDDNDFTAGIIVFYCKWRPITTSSTVVAGTGAAL